MAMQTHAQNSTTASGAHAPQNQTRRHVFELFANAAAVAAAIPLAAATVPALARPMIQEKPEILALGDALTAALAKYHAAEANKTAALERAKTLCPPVPDELVVRREDGTIFGRRFSNDRCAEDEVDLEGNTVHGPERVREDGQKVVGQPRWILQSEQLRNSMTYGGFGPRTKLGKRFKALIKTAEKYEAGVRAAKEQSGLDEAMEVLYFAGNEVEDVGSELHRHHEPVTMAGVVIFARALLAAKTVQPTTKSYFGDYIGNRLAASMVRVAGNDAAEAVR